jgi:hypothetical protein
MTIGPLGRHLAMIESSETPARVWPLRLMAATLFALGLVPMANIVAPGRGLQWWGQSVRLWSLWAIPIATLALLIARFAPTTCDALPGQVARLVLRPSRPLFMALVGATVCALAVYFAWYLFRLQPITIDELSLQWHGHLLATGHLFARAEPHAEFFSTTQTVEVGQRWFSHFPLGSSALIGAGMAVGLPWLVNPVLAALGAVAVYRFLASTTTELEARCAAVLFAFSPFVLFMAASQLDHVAALVAIWTAIAALPAWLASTTIARARRAAAIVGISLGVAATIRPYDAVLCAFVIGLFQLNAARRDRRLAVSLAAQVLAGAIPVALLLAANWATTGHPLTFAYDTLNGPAHRPGFHLDPMGELHTPRRGIYNVSAYLLRLDGILLGWPVPALLLVVAALAWQRRASRWDHLMVGILGMLLVGYWMFWGEGRSFGPRFLFTAAPVFLLSVCRFPALLRERFSNPLGRRAATVVVPLWAVLGWLLPADVAQPSGVWALARRAQEVPVATRMIERSVAEQGVSHALVFVSDGWRARLVARLSALGARPFAAKAIVGHYDACLLQHVLDSAERGPGTRAERARHVFAELDRAPTAVPLTEMSVADQIALQPDRLLDPECARELASARANGVDFARFLPRNATDGDGRLNGDIIYARDFGARNALLRRRFGDRAWYMASVVRGKDGLQARVVPVAH